MNRSKIKILVELFANKYGIEELQNMLIEALVYDGDTVVAKMERKVAYTLQIGREDVIQAAKSINMHIIESDIDYVLREYDNHQEIEAWSTIIENILYERKDKLNNARCEQYN